MLTDRTELNPSQRAAIEHGEGPALVLAGAGSGKTRTIVHRIAHLILERGLYPSELFAVTFTNKAAGEMRERLIKMIGPTAGDLWVSTFHAAALRILRAYGDLVGLQPGFVVFDQEDQLTLIRELSKELQIEARPSALKHLVERVKNRGGTPAMLEGENLMGLSLEELIELFERYQASLRQQNALDFDDLLLLAVRLLEEYPAALRKIQQRARFIHVDEYQDTNPIQYRFMRLLAGERPNLMVVGDPDQSIYGFRQADIRNILRFTEDFPGAKVYRLEENYRSSASILRLANAVIAANTLRLDKVLRPVRPEGEPVRLFRAPNAREEARYVAQEVRRLGDFGSIAVLYRTNAQSRLLEEALRQAGVPARLVGAVSFYERREIKDLLAYARLLVNPHDLLSLRRAVSAPPRGIGPSSLSKLIAKAQEAGWSPLEAFRQASSILSRPQPALGFAALIDELSEASQRMRPQAFFRLLIERSGLQQALAEEEGSEERLENLEEFLRAAGEWEHEEGGDLAAFLDRIALTAATDELQEGPAVTLMTLHNAKGLEFPYVFLVGLEENLLPHRNSLQRLEDLEEERRLFYVGITRAQERLYLSYAEEREVWGKRELSRPSRFLTDLPPGLWQEVTLFSFEPARSAPASSGEFHGGERVRHPRFGPGTVVAASGSEVTVHFPGLGLKRLAVRFAGLERIEES